MKKLLIIITLSLCFMLPSQADDVRDFQIEGISIGDSLLDYVSEDIIKANKKNYYDWIEKNKNKFSASEIVDKEKFPTYDAMQFAYKTDDPKYIIHDLVGLIDFKNNIQDCYEEKDKIEKELRDLFIRLNKTGYDKEKHPADSSGKSHVSASNYWFSGNSHMIGIKCTDWSKKMKYIDNLRIQIKTKEFNDWLLNR